MKNNLLLVFVGIVMMLTGCTKEEVMRNSNLVVKKFTVSVDNGAKTRAPMEVPTRYVMEVYKGATATNVPDQRKEQNSSIFTDVLLDDTQQYTILFWADYGKPTAEGGQLDTNNEYDVFDLKTVRVAVGKQPAKAAYAGVSRFTVGTDTEADYTIVKLIHAVAQVNFVQTEELISANNKLTVSFPESYQLNVDDNAVTSIAGAVEYTFDNIGKGAANKCLGTSYIIAATSTPKTVLEITMTMNDEVPKVLSNVPFERNFKTKICGAYSNLYDATMTAICDDTWEMPDNDDIFPKEAKLGDYYYDDNTFSTDLQEGKACIGIVFWVDPSDPTKGKIVSLDEPEANWKGLGNKASFLSWGKEIVTQATDVLDGAGNMTKIKSLSSDLTGYPAFAWCAAKTTGGTEWYLPAQKELHQLFAGISGLRWVASDASVNVGEIGDWGGSDVDMPDYTAYKDARAAFNDRLKSVNGTVLSIASRAWYRSSSENLTNKFSAWYIILSTGALSNGNKADYDDLKVRAISAF